jgi:hypothetical protein
MTTSITINPSWYSSTPSPAQAGKHTAFNGVNDDFIKSFGDIVDMVNPLQHIPIISTLYQKATGDTMGTAASLAGGAIFGGPIGLIASIANMIFEGETGQGVAGATFAAVTGKYEKAAGLS